MHRRSLIMRRAWLVLVPTMLLAALLALEPAQAQAPLVHDVTLEGAPGALRSFHAALRARRARVFVYGASHTAPDLYTGELRRRLQARFGDGGPGWVIPAVPFPFYDHSRLRISGTGWTGRMVRYRQRRRDAYGLAGIALDSNVDSSGHGAAAATVRSRVPNARFDRVVVHYLEQPRGGSLVVAAGAAHHEISTDGSRRAATHVITLPEVTDSVRVEASGAVRLFGLVLEREAGGVTVDAFGVPGARFYDQAPWSLPALARGIDARPPDLVAFAYGTNESAMVRVPVETYRERVREGLARWRHLAPEASCLLIGPGEWPRRRRDGALVPRRRTAQVIAVQREEAAAAGCAFFDTFRMMGSGGSMARWVDAGLALDDHVHFTDEGYRRMGSALERAVTRGVR